MTFRRFTVATASSLPLRPAAVAAEQDAVSLVQSTELTTAMLAAI